MTRDLERCHPAIKESFKGIQLIPSSQCQSQSWGALIQSHRRRCRREKMAVYLTWSCRDSCCCFCGFCGGRGFGGECRCAICKFGEFSLRALIWWNCDSWARAGCCAVLCAGWWWSFLQLNFSGCLNYECEWLTFKARSLFGLAASAGSSRGWGEYFNINH